MAMIGKSEQLESKSLILVINIKKFVVFLLTCLLPINDEIRRILNTVLANENEPRRITAIFLTFDSKVSPSCTTVGQHSMSLLFLLSCLYNTAIE